MGADLKTFKISVENNAEEMSQKKKWKNEGEKIKWSEDPPRRFSLNQKEFYKERMRKVKQKELLKKYYKRTFQNWNI